MYAHVHYSRKYGNCSETPEPTSTLLGYRILHSPVLALYVTHWIFQYFLHINLIVFFTQNNHCWNIMFKCMGLNGHSEEKASPGGIRLHVLQVIYFFFLWPGFRRNGWSLTMPLKAVKSGRCILRAQWSNSEDWSKRMPDSWIFLGLEHGLSAWGNAQRCQGNAFKRPCVYGM